MDGLQKRVRESVRLRLLAALTVTILIVTAVTGVLAFTAAFDDAQELQDDLLRQVARVAARQFPEPAPQANHTRSDDDDDADVTVQRFDAATSAWTNGAGATPLALPATLADGLGTVEAAGTSYRVLVRTGASGARIAVAQLADFRDDLAAENAIHAVLPLLVLMPILLLVAVTLVRRLFAPVDALAARVNARGEADLKPVAEAGVPEEVRPFIHAINGLLARVAQMVQTERRFVADAAHELRSPFAALSLQAERLARAELSDAARERLGALRGGIERARSLLEQLLALSRAQSEAAPAGAATSVQATYRHVLEDLLPLAAAKRIDVGVVDAGDARVLAGALDLRTLVKNLVDNAIRYTPEGGRVDLSVHAQGGHAVLRVIDTGPGIPPAERVRVFDPFYRVLGSGESGSGLGLSIVRTIAARQGGAVRLDAADPLRQAGLCVTVTLPLAQD